MNKLVALCIFQMIAMIALIFQWHNEKEQNIWFRDMHAMQTTQRELALQQAERDAIERGHKDHELVQEMYATNDSNYFITNYFRNYIRMDREWAIDPIKPFDGYGWNSSLTNLQFRFWKQPIVKTQANTWVITFEDK